MTEGSRHRQQGRRYGLEGWELEFLISYDFSLEITYSLEREIISNLANTWSAFHGQGNGSLASRRKSVLGQKSRFSLASKMRRSTNAVFGEKNQVCDSGDRPPDIPPPTGHPKTPSWKRFSYLLFFWLASCEPRLKQVTFWQNSEVKMN